MRIKTFALITASLAAVTSGLVYAQTQKPAAPTSITVYKTSSCGCCAMWVEHLKKNGFTVETHDVSASAVRDVSKAAGLKDEDTSCHTAKVGNYIVEGHVPAADIQKMLKEKPAIAGLSAPGMPQGSPGMEQGRSEPYNVVAFTKDGKTTVYATHK